MAVAMVEMPTGPPSNLSIITLSISGLFGPARAYLYLGLRVRSRLSLRVSSGHCPLLGHVAHAT